MTFNNHARRPEVVSGNKQEGFITIARVTRTQGRKGEVAAFLFTDFPERFAERKRLFLMNPLDDARMELQLEEHWFHKGQVVLKFAGVDSISDAERLVAWEVQIPLAERVPLEDGSFYISDLTGCRVFEKDREIGLIEDVRFGSGEAPLLVVQGNKEYLIPFAAAYIEELDIAQKRLVMQLPEGMLELDAPLNEEEKQRQKQQD